jgi:hypothetical protein
MEQDREKTPIPVDRAEPTHRLCKSKSVKLGMKGSDVLFSKVTRLGVSYTEHLFLTLRAVTGKLSNRSLKTKDYSTGLHNTSHFQEEEHNEPGNSLIRLASGYLRSVI